MAVVFEKKLTPTDVGKRLAIPTDCLNQFPGLLGGAAHAVDVKVKDKSRFVQTFRCSIRKKGIYPKPVFSAGWIKYARRKGLRVGDKVTIFMEEDHASSSHFKIEVKRKLVILGQDVWADVQ